MEQRGIPMFWFGKKGKKDGDKKTGDGKAVVAAPAPAKPSRADIIAQAKAHASAARAEIGDETLNKIRDAMMRKQNSPVEKAKARIKAMDNGKIADGVKMMLDEDRD
jgi:hypothetical protein